MCNILHKITQTLKSLSYPFLERKSRKQELGVGIQNKQARRLTGGDLVRKSLPYPQPPMNASTDAPFLERKSEISSFRGAGLPTYRATTCCVFTTFVFFVSFVVKQFVGIRPNPCHPCAICFARYPGDVI